MKKIITLCFATIAFLSSYTYAQNLPLLEKGANISISLNKKGTKGLDILVKDIAYRDSSDYSCYADVNFVFTSRNETIHFGQYQDFLGNYHEDFRFNLFNMDNVLQKNESIEKKVSIRLKQTYDRDSNLVMGKLNLMSLPEYDPQEYKEKERAKKKAIELANKARMDSIHNAENKKNNEIQARREKLLTPEYLANWVGASFFTKDAIENDCEVYPIGYSGGKVFYDFPQCPVTMEFTDSKQVCVSISFRLFGEDGYDFRNKLIKYGYKLISKSNALVAENNFGDLTEGKMSTYKCPLKSGGYSVCKITEGQAFMFEFYRSKK
jgi:hypothetical protein